MQTQPTGKKIRTKEVEDLEISELVALYEKKYNKKLNSLEALIVKAQIAMYKDSDKMVAKAKVRGEQRGGDMTGYDSDPVRVKEAVDRAWKRIAEQEYAADEARKKSKEFFRVAGEYQLSLRQLKVAFDELGRGGLGPVDDKALTISEDMAEADRQIALYKVQLQVVEQTANKFDDTVALIKNDGLLTTVEEAKGIGGRTLESIKSIDNAQKKLAEIVEAVNSWGLRSAEKIKTLVMDMAKKLVSWTQANAFNKNVDVFETAANGTVTAVNALNAEPLSHSALQGIHALIHGACDGIKFLRNLYGKWKLGKLEKTDINLVLDQLKADDYIQWKCDMVQMGLRWVTEPLGFVPHAGEAIRSGVDAAVKSCIDVVRKAAKEQARKFDEAKKKNPSSTPPPGNFESVIATFESELLAAAKKEVGEMVESVKDTIMDEVMDKGADLGGMAAEILKSGVDSIPDLIVGGVLKILASAVTPLLAKLLPEMKMIDKDTIKGAMASARQDAEKMNTKATAMKNLRQETHYTLDDGKLLEMSVAAALGLKPGERAPWVLIQTSVLEKTGGFALMIGEDHDPINKQFFEQMTDSGWSYRGFVTAGQVKGGLFQQRLYFDCLSMPSDKRRELEKICEKFMKLNKKRSLQWGAREEK